MNQYKKIYKLILDPEPDILDEYYFGAVAARDFLVWWGCIILNILILFLKL